MQNIGLANFKIKKKRNFQIKKLKFCSSWDVTWQTAEIEWWKGKRVVLAGVIDGQHLPKRKLPTRSATAFVVLAEFMKLRSSNSGWQTEIMIINTHYFGRPSRTFLAQKNGWHADFGVGARNHRIGQSQGLDVYGVTSLRPQRSAYGRKRSICPRLTSICQSRPTWTRTGSGCNNSKNAHFHMPISFEPEISEPEPWESRWTRIFATHN